MLDPNALISVADAAEYINMAVRTIHNRIDEGVLKNHGNDKTFKLLVSEVIDMVPNFFTFYNSKGGVGKSSLTRIFANFLSLILGKKVLVIDGDPQANVTKSFEYLTEIEKTFCDVLRATTESKIKATIKQAVYQVADNPNLFVMPAEIELDERIETKLEQVVLHKQLIYKYARDNDINAVLYDSQTSITGLTKFGVYLCEYLIMPLWPEAFSVEGLEYALKRMNQVAHFNEDFIAYRNLISRIKHKDNSVRELYRSEFAKELGNNLLDNFLPDTYMIGESQHNKSCIFHEYNEKNVDVIKALCEEIYSLIYIRTPERKR